MWYLLLLPVCLAIIIYGLPNLLEILRWIFETARWLAQASRS